MISLSLLRRATPWCLAVTAWAGLTGCQPAASVTPSDTEVLAAETRRPADVALAAKYERSCLSCHGVRGSAPLTGFAPHWTPRLAQGMPTLLAHTREGLRGMPAMGLCHDCSDDELRALITFMSTGQ